MILEEGSEAHLRVAGQQVECSRGEHTFAASVVRASSWEGEAGAFILSVPGRIRREYRGTLEVGVRDAKLLPVVIMDLEVAVASAVAAESPAGAPLEALKAQAIVTRSYYLGARRHSDFDFCDTTHCQFLRGPAQVDSPVMIAAASTRGLVLTYRGKVVPALFSASCGGRTRSLGEVGLSPCGYPYFSVACRYCVHHAASWKRVLSEKDAECLLRGPPTEAKRLKIDQKMGWSTIPGNNFELEVAGESVLIQGIGKGHGIGLCQVGASSMATDGSTFREILNHYYPNTSLCSLEN
jgi:stage II sporulation protein D